jgi:hypothetical protein
MHEEWVCCFRLSPIPLSTGTSRSRVKWEGGWQDNGGWGRMMMVGEEMLQVPLCPVRALGLIAAHATVFGMERTKLYS